MSDQPRADAYAKEIRSWLLARLAKLRNVGAVERVGPTSLPQRALYWWIFEGRRYPWLESSLATAWNLIDQHARRLLTTYNPK